MRKNKILVVDDDRPFALALSVRLAAAGFDVLTALDAERAATMTLRERPDLILLDVDMPRYSGFELHECFQFSERARRIPVVYLSENDSVSNRLLAQQQGARAFVSKPYDPKQLIALLEKVLNAPRRSPAPVLPPPPPVRMALAG